MTSLPRLHLQIDEQASTIAGKLGERLKCKKGCADCCTDDLTVLEVEAANIRARYPTLLANGMPHPPGGCAFLDDLRACRIYPARPYICRTQGLPLRYFEEDENEDIVETRDICPINGEGPDLHSLSDGAMWLIGPTEQILLDLQDAAARGVSPGAEDALSSALPKRIALRDLFKPPRS